ncbi:MAG: signal peptide peptidase SppA [Microcoleaceae cyanobacterium]
MKDFLKYTTASLLGNLLAMALAIAAGVGGLLFLIGLTATQKTEPLVKNKSVLTLDLSLDIPDSDPEYTTDQVLQRAVAETELDQLKLRTVLDSIERASQDDDIVGIFLQGSGAPSSTGLANLKEVRQELQRFRETGKPIIAYDTDWTEQEYYLASVATNLVTNPLGSVELNGLSSEVMFLSGAMEKYGVGVQVTRVGKYKSAVEPFLLDKMSPENRQQTERLLGDLWTEWVQAVSQNRELTSAQLQQIANRQGILTSDEALSGQLIDQVGYFDEVLVELRKLTGEEPEQEGSSSTKPFRQVTLQTYSKTPEVTKLSQGNSSSKNKIAIVYAEGGIVDGQGIAGQIGGDRLSRELRKVRFDDDVKAVVLRVNSPGGSATASEVIGREVELMKQAKPIVVSMGNFAASGGYWISMEADEIFAEPNTITGSIGVFGLLFNVKEIANKNGVTWDVVKTAPYADIDTVSRPKTPQDLQQIHKIVDSIYERFLDQVAESRDLPRSKVEDIAQGRVWSGSSAKDLGLVDQIGGLETAIAAAAAKAELGEDWQVEEYPEVRSLSEKIIENLSETRIGQSSTVTPDPLSIELTRLRQELETLKSFNDPKGIYMRLPFNLRVY